MIHKKKKMKQTSYVEQDLSAHHHFHVHYQMIEGPQLIYLMVFLDPKIIAQNSCKVSKVNYSIKLKT